MLIALVIVGGLTAALTLASVARFLAYCRGYRAPQLAEWPVAYTLTPFKSDGDETFEQNVISILEQDYPRYTSIFVTHSEDDPGVPIIRKLMARYPHTQLKIAGRAAGCSQMIHNQLAALDVMPADAEAIVVIDSDLRLRPDTLKQLIAPLADKRVGTTFGYPHYLPPRRNLASLVRSFWNLCGALFLADPVAKYPWGGLFALTRETAARLNLHALWGPCLTDDFPLGEALRREKLEQRFVPTTLLPAYEGGTPMSLIKWTDKRQTIMRVYHPAMWWQIAIGLTGLHAAVLALAALSGSPALAWGAVGALAYVELLVFTALTLAMRTVVPESKAWTAIQIVTLPLVAPLSLLLVTWNTLVSAVTRKVAWGGLVYELASPRDVRMLPPTKRAA